MPMANVWFWHYSDLAACPPYVRYRGHFGRQMLAVSISPFDPSPTLAARLHRMAACRNGRPAQMSTGRRVDVGTSRAENRWSKAFQPRVADRGWVGWRTPPEGWRMFWRNGGGFADKNMRGRRCLHPHRIGACPNGQIHACCTCRPRGDAIFVARDGCPRQPGNPLSRAMRKRGMPSISSGVSTITQVMSRRLQLRLLSNIRARTCDSYLMLGTAPGHAAATAWLPGCPRACYDRQAPIAEQTNMQG
jgi:hypothetical protein